MTPDLLDRQATDTEFARIVAELTRRGFLAGTVGTAALLGLGACGSSSSGADSGTQSAVTTRTVSTIYGDVEVPADPKRVVALDFPEGCALLDLGLTPIGVPDYMPDFSAYTTALRGVPVVTDVDGKPLVEKVASLQPDLIVTADWADSKQRQMPYAQLRSIAPTAVFTWEQAAGNWQEQAAATADAVNKTAVLAALRAKYAEKGATIKKTYGSLFARTRWDVIDCSQNVWDLYGKASSHGQVLSDAGVPLNAGRTQTTGYQEYSFERFDLLAGTDVIVTTNASLPYLNKQASFTALPAVKAGQVYATDLFFPASYGIALALLGDLDTICRKVQEGS